MDDFPELTAAMIPILGTPEERMRVLMNAGILFLRERDEARRLAKELYHNVNHKSEMSYEEWLIIGQENPWLEVKR